MGLTGFVQGSIQDRISEGYGDLQGGYRAYVGIQGF